MADIGDKLRSAREAKGLSIEDIEKATKIQSRYLTAIEDDDFDKLPGDFYVRAFIRQYAQVVGLDGKKLLSEYQEDVPESKPDEYVEDSIDNKSEEVKKTTDNKKNLWKNYLPKIAIGLGIIIVVLIGYVLYARLSSGGQRNNTASNNVKVSTQTSSSSSSKKLATTTNPVKVSRLSDNEFRITGLKSNRNLVISVGDQNVTSTVSINGIPKWSQTLTSNQKHTITLPKDASRVVVTFSNDKDTSMKIAGKKIPYTVRNSYATLTLLIGNAKRKSTTTHHNNSGNSTNNSATTNNGTSSDSTTTHSNNGGATTSSSSNNTTSNENRSHESSRTQSSATTQSSAQTQSSSSERHEETQSSSQPTTQQQSTENNNNNARSAENNAGSQNTQQNNK
ncbi:helix-turn-helix domain-containing protein [Lactobacillus intestinalis]|uniref:helix-turn-helix domain-containing protein n=1 Tax=Lactobacillus intestinalis TaxID=151781 RepID=UPI001F5AC102|nr:helix-turn-helix domain-containing protein [Lactobacillus intestinalis]